jgi:hypothetical protein
MDQGTIEERWMGQAVEGAMDKDSNDLLIFMSKHDAIK